MRIATLLLATIAFAVSCNRADQNGDRPFDRSAMLENYADNRIIPVFQQLQQRTAALQSACLDLVTAPVPANLNKARAFWLATFETWQQANAFNFGPAGPSGPRKSLAEEIATFPADTLKILQNISSGDTAMHVLPVNTRGLFALEFLLFSNTEAEILADITAGQRGKYLYAIANHLDSRVDATLAGWNDAWRQNFISSNGTDAGSSTAMVFNEFIKSYELLKNFKLGRPLGKRIGQTGPEPLAVEAPYSQRSTAAMALHFEALVDIWEGRGLDDTDGPGFRDYLQTTEGGAELIQKTELQIAEIRIQLNSLDPNTPLNDLITLNPAALEPLYQALSRHTRFWKSDMSSILGLYITYSSGDGD